MYARRSISVLTSLLAIGVCVYISYISRDVGTNSLAINLGFLGIMVIAVLLSIFTGVVRLTRISSGLRRAADIIRTSASEDEVFLEKNLFRDKFLDDNFAQYCDMVRRHPDGSCDISDFINEDSIEIYIHRGLLELVPDFLASLGILGTFIGLVLGLRNFDPSGYEQMADSVSPLIDGIKVAFVTSIYGLSLSLPFSLNLRNELTEMSNQLESFIDAYYLYVHPSHEVDSSVRLLEQKKGQEELANQLTQIFVDQLAKTYEQTITPAFEQMTDAVHQIVQTFTVHQEDAISDICTTIVKNIHSDLNESLEQVEQNAAHIEQAEAEFADFMDRAMMRLQQSFTDLQNHVEQADRYNEQTMTTLMEAQQEAFRITDEQKATYQEYIRFMYQSIEEFSEVWELNSEKIQGYSDEIIKLGPVQSNVEVRKDLANLSAQLEETRKHQATAEETSINQEQTEQLLVEILKKLNNLEKASAEPVLFRRRKK